jgi:hypothetical protein
MIYRPIYNYCFNSWRETKGRKVKGECWRHCILLVKEKQRIAPAPKVPRHSPLILLADISLQEGKVLASEESVALEIYLLPQGKNTPSSQ